MTPEIFDIDTNGKVVINVNCLLIPELKSIYDKYSNPVPPFSYIHYKLSGSGPYVNVPELDKDEILTTDFPGDYDIKDEEIVAAIKKIEFLNETPSYRYYIDSKTLLEKMGKIMREQEAVFGKDGNSSFMQNQLNKIGKTISEFKVLEETIQKELKESKSAVRGDYNLSYDTKM